MERLGYNGKVLHIDIENQTSTTEDLDDVFWRIYGGGGLLATYYLMKLCRPGIDAFDSTNLLVLASSVLAGHPYAGLARFTAAAKSPLTGGIGETRCEGPFGIALKASGYDAIVIRGRSETPISILIEDGAVAFHDAAPLWGGQVSATVDRLESDFGKGIATAVIGPAGENLVRYASIVTERGFQAPRMGLGAVMGSKHIKAIALKGHRSPSVAFPDTCKALTESYRQRMADNPLTRWQLDPPGFTAWVHLHGIEAALCTRNYRDSLFEGADAYDTTRFLEHYVGERVCPGCPNNCIKEFAVDDSTPDGAGSIHQEVSGTLGPNLGISDLDAVLRANVLCNEFGLDPTSLGFTLSMAMECAERGILDESGTDGLPRFGDSSAMLAMIPWIAHRQGFGDVLAEGVRRAAARIGPAAEACAMHVKGLEMTCFEPRTQTNLALGYAVASIGPRYDICEHDWDYHPDLGWPHTMESSRTVGILERIPMQHVGIDKVRNFKALNTLWSGADTLDLCVFAVAPTRIFTLEEMADLLHAVTGWNTSSYEIMRWGERRNHLMRVYNLREGLTADDDWLPDRFFDEPISQGTWEGTKLDRTAFSEAISAYYRMMGWDAAGRPLYETLVDHHLEWVVADGHFARL
ncbi:MAG: aldehyde ferredoxin oxidoreductase family protein [Azospirillaceae bacterium]